ncbi:rhombosortase [Pelagicoccus sp. SDUM812002]|uniref:rhombosortase n=1 Tax=Pelagicoccus sp. SDUM812002 TaxID=3041266 RepID=UPI00280CFB1E|nr:rhombosortase [Pelagicoccus sp. SDUM812002]MDQ8184914.1 rhombosortase [Pelagicoccus sp. SDUM812002]
MKIQTRIPWITLLLGAFAALAFAGGTATFEALAWRADWLQSGEYWKVVTGHFAHASASHLAWDLRAFLILGACVERRCRGRLLALLGGTMLLSEIALSWSGRFALYCGLSGLDVALFAAAAFQLLQKGKMEGDRVLKGLGAGALVLAICKVGLEVFGRSPFFVSGLQASFSVAWEAHLAGLAAALLAGGYSLSRSGSLTISNERLG